MLPRVYPILDTASLERVRFDPLVAAEALLEGGAGILQFRHKGYWSRDVFALAETVAGLCRSAGVPFIVNDRADYAALLDAGVHVGQEDLTPEDARRVVGGAALVGYSTHNPEQMRRAAAEPVDYVAFGPVFPTTTKERADPTVGTAMLAAMRGLTDRPLVAIGGITLENAALCRGSDSLAIISGLLPDEPSKEKIRERMSDWLRLSAMLHK